MSTTFPLTPSLLTELDPVASARLDDLDLTFSTDAERAAAVIALQAVDAAHLAAPDPHPGYATLEEALAQGRENFAPAQKWVAGRYYGTPVHTLATGNMANVNRVEMSPVIVPSKVGGQGIDRIAFEVTTGGDATSRLRGLIYANTDDRPGTKLFTAASQVADVDASTVGIKEQVIAFTFPEAGGLHFLAVMLAAATTAPTIRRLGSAPAIGSYKNLTDALGGANTSPLPFHNAGDVDGPVSYSTTSAIGRVVVRAA